MSGLFRPETTLGRLLRLPLKLLPKSMIMPVLSGPNRGLRWQIGAGIHGSWIGSYERHKVDRFVSAIAPGAVVYDIGAHAGYYTLAAARHARQVLAFEPDPRNAAALRRHIALNRLANVEIVEAAVALAPGHVLFARAGSLYQGRVAGEGTPIAAVSLDALIAAGKPPPDLVKMDVEGGELAALDGARHLLAGRRTIWFIALHGRDCALGTTQRLLAAGYRVEDLDGAPIAAPRGDIDEIVALPG